jgi:hypothetical protein
MVQLYPVESRKRDKRSRGGAAACETGWTAGLDRQIFALPGFLCSCALSNSHATPPILPIHVSYT